MTQTTGAASMRNCVVEYSTNSTSWTDISGVANQVNPSGYEVEVGEAYTGDSHDPVLTAGKNSPLDLEVNVVYSESASEGYHLLRTLKEATTPVRIRWQPKGRATGNYRYTTGTGYLTAAPAPGGELGGGMPILTTIAGRFPSVAAAAATDGS